MDRENKASVECPDAVALIGMAGRFPGAANLREFWNNLRNSAESISFFGEEELRAAGVPESMVTDPNYIRACGMLSNADLFDASFFGFSPREAEITDPQHRVFLECAWEALEHAGYAVGRESNCVGVFAGVSPNIYQLNLYCNPDVANTIGTLSMLAGNNPDYLATRVSYKLNLQGPSVCVQTACSTSLVAVVMGCQSLLAGECDMALAGGVSVSAEKAGYYYRAGGIQSPDGHCRAYDARAQGTVRGDGVGVVVLKRLGEALAEGDTIQAVIRGAAINNDGGRKVGYTAPSVQGQAAVIRMALALADVEAGSIGYVEGHGTGTALGDPVEVAALQEAYGGGRGTRKQYCALGSVKSNIGHLDAAAGVAGLIKTVLSLQHKQIPASLHYEEGNREIKFAESAFYVNTKLRAWEVEEEGGRRRAGVSSFGIGGTNAHVIVEEAPEQERGERGSRGWQMLMLSGRTEAAVERAGGNLAQYLKENRGVNLGDVAYTLQVGRKGFEHRQVVLCRDVEGAIAGLEGKGGGGSWKGQSGAEAPAIAFLFPGQGCDVRGLGKQMYGDEEVFRGSVEECGEILRAETGCDVGAVLYGEDDREVEPEWVPPLIFTAEYALARQWMSWGIRPEAMLGHSMGEYVAACLAGVFRLPDALRLIALRARLMRHTNPGAMLSVGLGEADLAKILDRRLEIAALNGVSQSVVSGPTQAIQEFASELARRGHYSRYLSTSGAFHSALMDAAIAPLVDAVRATPRGKLQNPYVSCLTGTWITDEQANDPTYWGNQMRRTVRFKQGLDTLWVEKRRVVLEVGPARSLASLAREGRSEGRVFSSLGDVAMGEKPSIYAALGRLWISGATVDWRAFWTGENRRRVPLPTYPFERERYWIRPVEDRKPEEEPESALSTGMETSSSL
jgi:acyl transferase domain-containing protein